MDARLKRIAADYEQIKKHFGSHKYITVTPEGDEPPEKYHVTYHVPGIYLRPDGKIETLKQHEVEIFLHADYPRYKPICKILTPIWHPNFRDGQICIGDIWGAGESLSDIIINIGNMIQYKSWNSSSPLSADAAAWAVENKQLFPIGNCELYFADDEAASKQVEIDVFDDPESENQKAAGENGSLNETETAGEMPALPQEPENDFEITAEELEGIEFVPSAQRMQGGAAAAGESIKVKINFKTVLVKGILWALIGAFVGFGFGELAQGIFTRSTVASMLGYRNLSQYFKYSDRSDKYFAELYTNFEKYCRENNMDPNEENSFSTWAESAGEKDKQLIADFKDANTKEDDYLSRAYKDDFASDRQDAQNAIARVLRISTGIWAGVIALFVGMFLGIGEGVYYGSKKNGIRYALIGAAVSFVIGSISGYLAQWMYVSLLSDDSSAVIKALIRGAGWAIMGLGIGAAIGLIKPDPKRIAFCSLGGLIGAFIGGFLFNFIGEVVPADVVARGVAIIVMGILIGVGVGLLEQFAKSAWLKVIRGEFEGKEYLVFPGVTSIGNDGSNTIVLFKDKLVAQHHCDIVMQGSKYILQDCGTPTGTVVNGRKTKQCILQQNDKIAIGNSILVFNSK